MKLGGIDILDLKLGSAQINEVRHGVNLIWQKTVAATFEAETTAFMEDADVAIANDSTVYYSGTVYETTGAALWTAIDNFIKREKAAGRWINLVYFRPRVKGTALANAVNLRDVSTFRGTYFGSWTHSGAGSIGNGANTYMLTGLTPSTHQTQGASGMGGVLRAFNKTVTSYPVLMGSYVDGTSGAIIYTPRNNEESIGVRYNSDFYNKIATSALGVVAVNRVTTSGKVYLNGGEFNSYAAGGTLPTNPLEEGAQVVNGNRTAFLDGTIGSTFCFNNFSASDVAGFSSSVDTLELDLKRKNW